VRGGADALPSPLMATDSGLRDHAAIVPSFRGARSGNSESRSSIAQNRRPQQSRILTPEEGRLHAPAGDGRQPRVPLWRACQRPGFPPPARSYACHAYGVSRETPTPLRGGNAMSLPEPQHLQPLLGTLAAYVPIQGARSATAKRPFTRHPTHPICTLHSPSRSAEYFSPESGLYPLASGHPARGGHSARAGSGSLRHPRLSPIDRSAKTTGNTVVRPGPPPRQL